MVTRNIILPSQGLCVQCAMALLLGASLSSFTTAMVAAAAMNGTVWVDWSALPAATSSTAATIEVDCCEPFLTRDPAAHKNGGGPFGSYTVAMQDLGAEFVRLSLLGTLQYIPCSLVVTAASVVGTLQGAYHEGRFRFDDVYLYAIIVGSYRSGSREHSRARCNRGAREGNRTLKRAGHPFSFVLIS